MVTFVVRGQTKSEQVPCKSLTDEASLLGVRGQGGHGPIVWWFAKCLRRSLQFCAVLSCLPKLLRDIDLGLACFGFAGGLWWRNGRTTTATHAASRHGAATEVIAVFGLLRQDSQGRFVLEGPTNAKAFALLVRGPNRPVMMVEPPMNKCARCMQLDMMLCTFRPRPIYPNVHMAFFESPCSECDQS